MRISYKINKNTFVTYIPSPESLILIGELNRYLLAEDFNWDTNHCPSLTTICIRALNKDFEQQPILNELPCEDRDHLLEILDTNLPLPLVVPLIDDDIYWERRFAANYEKITFSKKETTTWKRLYIERYIQDTVENAQPEHNDEDNMADITTLCAPFVRKLTVTQLQTWKPPLHWDEEDIPEKYPIDHISFEPILKNLPNIVELTITYGMKNVTDNFKADMFKLSVADCQKLAKAINHLKSLRVLRVHRSKLEDPHCRALMQGFIRNETVEELDLSHCSIGNDGALCIAKILCVHPALRILNLCNNRIGQLGCEGLGFALLEPGCSLQKLNLKLNPLFEGGAMGIMRALVRGTTLEELSMAVCQYNDDAPIRTGQMLLLNTSLKKLDVSNNWFDEDGGKALVEGLTVNRTLEWLDIRETDITHQQRGQIHKLLLRNRRGLDDIESVAKEASEEDGNVQEDLSHQTTSQTNVEPSASVTEQVTLATM